MKFRIEAKEHYNLSTIHRMLRDGKLGLALDEDELVSTSSGGKLWGSGGNRVSAIIVSPKSTRTKEEVEALIQRIIEAAGPDAHVHVK